MNPALAVFGGDLPGWVLRGTLCSLSSFFWAVLTGFGQPAEILGMMAGVALWVLIFAGFSFWSGPGWSAGRCVVPALKRAAWIKFGVTVGGWLLFAGINMSKLHGARKLETIAMLDVWLGLVALGLANAVGGFHGQEHISTLNSFGWTTLVTLIDGALFAVVIGLITLLVLGWWRLKAGSDSKSESSPV